MATPIAILGSGAWGTAIALLLAQRDGHRVTLWCARPASAEALLRQRENTRLLPGFAIPESIQISADPDAALASAELLVFAIPTVHLRATLQRLAGRVRPDVPAVSLIKGLETGTFRRPTQLLAELLGLRRVAALSGPSHAEEVARGLPTSVVAASENPELAMAVQATFSTERFRVYTNLDLVGVELAGALKNVLGIAAGICEGLGLGDNARAALLTRGLAEMARLGVALGAEGSTFWGLAGVGDLLTTCYSSHGRNRAVGLRLARGETREAIQGSTATVAEGITTARSIYERATQMGLPMPIATEVYRVLYEGKDPRQAVDTLMHRERRSE